MRLALPLLLLAALLLPTSSADHRFCWPDTDACLSEGTSSTEGCPYASEEGVTSIYADGVLVWASGERYDGCGYTAHTTVVLVRAQGSEVEWYGRTSSDPNDPGQC